MLAPLPFASLFGRKVAWSWKVVVLCHPCDRSLLFGCHLLSLAFLEGGVAGFCGDGSRSPGWKEVRGILSFLGDVDGYFRGWQGCCSLSLFVGKRPFLFFYYFSCFLGWAFIHFLKRYPLDFTLQIYHKRRLSRAHPGACLHIFFIVFGCSGSYFKNNQDILENNMGHLLSFLAFSLLVLFARKI